MTLLDALAAIALVGTDRRAPELPELGGGLGAAVAAQPWDADPARAVLAAAALATAHDRAGCLADAVDRASLPESAARETLPVCPPGAVTLLRRLLSDSGSRAALPDWLERVATRGERAPASLIPDLLDAGNDDRKLRAPVLRATGNRGSWLAAQHPDWWSWAVPRAVDDGAPGWDSDSEPVTGDGADASSTWQLGAFDLRLAELERVRANDPSAARAMIESTWDQDAPTDRARFLATLRDGLAADDEPLLERALADRRQEVRLEAASLLTALPSSAYRARLAARLHPLVAMRGTLRPQLTIELPGEIDAAARRDGLRAKQRDGLGPQSALLADLVAGAGLAPWTGTLTPAKRPADAIALAARSDHAPALMSGWREAAKRERHPAWLAALAIHDQDPDLLADLALTDAEPAALELLARSKQDAWQILSALEGPWSASLSQAVLRTFKTEAAQHYDRPLQRAIARRLHPALLDPALDLLSRRPEPAPPLDALRHVIDLRLSLIRELPTS